MKKILFVCHGNICRSPMAEYVMKDLVKKAGLEDEFHIASAATSRPEQEVADPWYTGDFDAAWRDVLAGCRGLLECLEGK